MQPYTLMTPGPVPLHKDVLTALARPMEHHRTPEFEKLFQQVLTRLKDVFRTAQPAFVLTSTGSGGMEAALVNVLSPGDEVLAVVSGKFGERWAEMAETFGARVHRLDIPWGQAATADQIAETLNLHPSIKIVLCQACETSTGVLHPIKEIAEVVARTPALFLVDAITALGATPLPMDEWRLDVVVGGSQKAFMLPTGLSLISFSKKAWKAVETARSPRYYFDIRAELQANLKGETRFSASVPLIRALDVVLNLFHQQGLSAFFTRIDQLARATRESGQAMGLKSFPSRPSPTITALALPVGVDGQKVRDEMERAHRVTVMGGQDQLKGKIIRIGHMGAIENDDLVRTIEALGNSLMTLYPGAVNAGQVRAAVETCRHVLNSR